MRILLTGSFGNIGRDVLRLLLGSGYRVRCFYIEAAARILGPVLRIYFSAQSPYFRAHWKRRLGLGKAKAQESGIGPVK